MIIDKSVVIAHDIDKTTTFNALSRDYLTKRGPRLKPKTTKEMARLLGTVMPELGTTPVEKLTTAKIEEVHTSMADTPYQANRLLAAISTVLTWGVRRRLVTFNAARGIPRYPERSRLRYARPDELARLRDALAQENEEIQDFFSLLLLTGARPSELAGARWDFLKDKLLELPDTKTGPRRVYLSPDARDLLARLQTRRGVDGFIFRPRLRVREAWDRVRRKAGCPDLRIYDLRRTFASAGLAAGLSLEVIGQLLGHTDLAATKVYARMMEGTGLHAAAAIGAYLTGGANA